MTREPRWTAPPGGGRPRPPGCPVPRATLTAQPPNPPRKRPSHTWAGPLRAAPPPSTTRRLGVQTEREHQRGRPRQSPTHGAHTRASTGRRRHPPRRRGKWGRRHRRLGGGGGAARGASPVRPLPSGSARRGEEPRRQRPPQPSPRPSSPPRAAQPAQTTPAAMTAAPPPVRRCGRQTRGRGKSFRAVLTAALSGAASRQMTGTARSGGKGPAGAPAYT